MQQKMAEAFTGVRPRRERLQPMTSEVPYIPYETAERLNPREFRTKLETARTWLDDQARGKDAAYVTRTLDVLDTRWQTATQEGHFDRVASIFPRDRAFPTDAIRLATVLEDMLNNVSSDREISDVARLSDWIMRAAALEGKDTEEQRYAGDVKNRLLLLLQNEAIRRAKSSGVFSELPSDDQTEKIQEREKRTGAWANLISAGAITPEEAFQNMAYIKPAERRRVMVGTQEKGIDVPAQFGREIPENFDAEWFRTVLTELLTSVRDLNQNDDAYRAFVQSLTEVVKTIDADAFNVRDVQQYIRKLAGLVGTVQSVQDLDKLRMETMKTLRDMQSVYSQIAERVEREQRRREKQQTKLEVVARRKEAEMQSGLTSYGATYFLTEEERVAMRTLGPSYWEAFFEERLALLYASPTPFQQLDPTTQQQLSALLDYIRAAGWIWYRDNEDPSERAARDKAEKKLFEMKRKQDAGLLNFQILSSWYFAGDPEEAIRVLSRATPEIKNQLTGYGVENPLEREIIESAINLIEVDLKALIAERHRTKERARAKEERGAPLTEDDRRLIQGGSMLSVADLFPETLEWDRAQRKRRQREIWSVAHQFQRDYNLNTPDEAASVLRDEWSRFSKIYHDDETRDILKQKWGMQELLDSEVENYVLEFLLSAKDEKGNLKPIEERLTKAQYKLFSEYRNQDPRASEEDVIQHFLQEPERANFLKRPIEFVKGDVELYRETKALMKQHPGKTVEEIVVYTPEEEKLLRLGQKGRLSPLGQRVFDGLHAQFSEMMKKAGDEKQAAGDFNDEVGNFVQAKREKWEKEETLRGEGYALGALNKGLQHLVFSRRFSIIMTRFGDLPTQGPDTLKGLGLAQRIDFWLYMLYMYSL